MGDNSGMMAVEDGMRRKEESGKRGAFQGYGFRLDLHL